MTIVCVFGTRPECIKLAPVIARLRKMEKHRVVVVATAQHRSMLDETLSVFGIKPDYDLNVMTGNQDLFQLTSKLLRRLQTPLQEEAPDWVIVQGDTTSTLAGALSAFYLKVPVAHVEAGLRTRDRMHPYPEETNRRIVSSIAELHFAPTEKARQNLLHEGIPEHRIHVTGNTVVDALHDILGAQTEYRSDSLRKLNLSRSRMILSTIHRRESFGEPLRRLCAALKEIAASRDVDLIFPVHPNPNVRAEVFPLLGETEGIHLTEPVPYDDFVRLMAASHLILTDSGGIQEEAPSLGKPVLVLRQVSERPEGIEAGKVEVVGTQTERIVERTIDLLDHPKAYAEMVGSGPNPFGDGRAAERIAEKLS